MSLQPEPIKCQLRILLRGKQPSKCLKKFKFCAAFETYFEYIGNYDQYWQKKGTYD